MRIVLLVVLSFSAWAADLMPPVAEQQLAREIYKQMIEVKSGFTTGSTTPIAEAVAARFKAAGFPASDIFVGGAIPTKANVVAHITGLERTSRFCCWHMPMLLKRYVRIGRWIRSFFSKRMDSSTAAARRMTRRRRRCGSRRYCDLSVKGSSPIVI